MADESAKIKSPQWSEGVEDMAGTFQFGHRIGMYQGEFNNS